MSVTYPSPLLKFSPLETRRSFLPSVELQLHNIHPSVANALPRTLVRWVSTIGLNPNVPDHCLIRERSIDTIPEKLRSHIEQIQWRIPSELLDDIFETSIPDVTPKTEMKADLKTQDLKLKLKKDENLDLNQYHGGSKISPTLNSKNSLKFTLKYSHPVAADPHRPKNIATNMPDRVAVLSEAIQWEPWSDEQKQKVERYYQTKAPDFLSLDGRVCRPNYEDIILETLRSGESVDAVFYLTKMNTASTNEYGGSPVTSPTVIHLVPTIDILRPISDIEDIDFLVDVCPKKIFSKTTDALTSKPQLKINNPESCIHCNQCLTLPNDPQRIVLGDKEDQVNVLIETRNGIPLLECIDRGFKQVLYTCESYINDLDKLSFV